jgi:pyrroline-5-carboxylate reductase
VIKMHEAASALRNGGGFSMIEISENCNTRRSTMPLETRIGFLGAGKMATALARGWLSAGLAHADRMLAADPLAESRRQFTAETGVRCSADNREVAAAADVLILAVKPQSMAGVLAELSSVVKGSHLVVSIAAGITLRQIQQKLPKCRVIRVMPNTPCLVGASASAYAAGEHATADDVTLVHRLLEAVGKCFAVSEAMLDAVTGLSGSGPAFVYLVIEALSDGGVCAGLPRDVATALAAQTVLGSARMVLETSQHPGALKDAVTSPAGTTMAGLQVLERAAVRGAFIDAVVSATERARALAN